MITTYNNTTLAAGALHGDILANKIELKSICSKLPLNAETIVQFMVAADFQNSKTQATIYHAATVKITKTSEKGCTVTAHIASYVKGSYQTVFNDIPQIADKTTQSDSANIAANEDNQIVVNRYPILTSDNALNPMKAETSCPEALAIANSVNAIFRQGVPLPKDQKFHYCMFTVMVKKPASDYQFLGVNYGIRGTHSSREESGNWAVTSVENEKNPSQPSRLKNKFAELTLVAEGSSRPLGVPSDAIQIGGVAPSRIADTTRVPRIEEIN